MGCPLIFPNSHEIKQKNYSCFHVADYLGIAGVSHCLKGKKKKEGGRNERKNKKTRKE